MALFEPKEKEQLFGSFALSCPFFAPNYLLRPFSEKSRSHSGRLLPFWWTLPPLLVDTSPHFFWLLVDTSPTCTAKQKSDLPKQIALAWKIYELETRYFVKVRDAASVSLPHEPSTAIPAAFWKSRTAPSVASPYFPLTDMLIFKAQFRKR